MISSIFSLLPNNCSQGFQISPSKIKSVGEEIWAGLQEVASTASKEPLGPDRSALMEEKLRRQE